MSTTSDEELFVTYQHTKNVLLAKWNATGAEVPLMDDHHALVAGLRAVAAAAWDEAMDASSTGVIIDGKYVKHPNPYSENALVVPPQDQD